MEKSQLKSDGHIAFLVGHVSVKKFTGVILENLLRPYCGGSLKVCYPFKKWKGYTFIKAPNRARIEQFLALKTIVIEGSELIIKPYLEGTTLEHEKHRLRNKRIFVRLVSRSQVLFSFQDYFSSYGEIESCHVVDNQKSS